MQNKDNFKRYVNQGKTVYSTEVKILNLSTTNVIIEMKLNLLGRLNMKLGIGNDVTYEFSVIRRLFLFFK
jgi:hypothetical protein